MPNAPTPILGLIVPTPGGDSGTWGNELNTDLAIIDNLGAARILTTSANLTLTLAPAVETIVRVTTGNGTVFIALPDPTTCIGKIFTVKKIDAGTGGIDIVPTASLIDGNSSWNLTGQYSDLRMLATATGYDVL